VNGERGNAGIQANGCAFMARFGMVSRESIELRDQKTALLKRTIEGQKIDVNVVDSPVDELLTNRLAVNIPYEYCGYWG